MCIKSFINIKNRVDKNLLCKIYFNEFHKYNLFLNKIQINKLKNILYIK